jgi:hypothetical protein
LQEQFKDLSTQRSIFDYGITNAPENKLKLTDCKRC